MVYHYWLSKRGYIFSSEKTKPTKGKERLKYMGFSSDIEWPKRMSTGRLLHQHQTKKKKKLPDSHKTDIAFESAMVERLTVPTQRSSNGAGSPSFIVKNAKAAKLPPGNEVRVPKRKN